MLKSNRQSNIELLRVIAMLMVTTLHALGHGGVLEQYEFSTPGYILFWTFETLCYVAVNVFVLITGYFMVTSEAKPSRLIKLYFQVEFYSILCLLAAKFIFHQSIGLKSILNTLFPFTSCLYWFVSSYAILIALVPFLNIFIKSLNQKQHLMTVVLLTALFCVIPTFMFWSRDILGNGYSFVWFIVLYITAAYIRIYSEDIPKKSNLIKHTLTYLILCGGGIVSRLIIGNLTELVIRNRLGEGVLYAYNSVLIFPASVSLFMAFRNIKIKSKIVTNVAASLGAVCFGTYLVTDNPLIRASLWEYINLSQYCKFGVTIMIMAMMVTVILLFMLGCLIEYYRMCFENLIKIKIMLNLIDYKLTEKFDMLLFCFIKRL